MKVLELAEKLGTTAGPILEAGQALGLRLADGTSDIPDEREHDLIRELATQAVTREWPKHAARAMGPERAW
jgi:hypothetical protein